MSDDVFTFSLKERQRISLLVVEPDRDQQELLRSVMRSFSFGMIAFASNHHEGVCFFNERRFTHVIFPAVSTNMPVNEFVRQLLVLYPDLVLVPAAWKPGAEDVFTLLQLGCRGYLCKPFSYEGVEAALIQATKGEPIAQAILDARDRNEAFAALLAGCVDRTAMLSRQARDYSSAKRELQRAQQRLEQASMIAKTFARESEEVLRDTIVDFLINLSNGPATRLGRLRRKLSINRTESPVQTDSPPDSEA